MKVVKIIAADLWHPIVQVIILQGMMNAFMFYLILTRH